MKFEIDLIMQVRIINAIVEVNNFDEEKMAEIAAKLWAEKTNQGIGYLECIEDQHIDNWNRIE